MSEIEVKQIRAQGHLEERYFTGSSISSQPWCLREAVPLLRRSFFIGRNCNMIKSEKVATIGQQPGEEGIIVEPCSSLPYNLGTRMIMRAFTSKLLATHDAFTIFK
jgi:hypothetical protein